MKFYLKNPKLLDNPLASFLIILVFLLSNTAHFNKSSSFLLHPLVFAFCIFSTLQTIQLNSIKVRVFFEKNIEKNHLCHHNKNYCYFCKSNISVTNLIVGSRIMIKLSENISL